MFSKRKSFNGYRINLIKKGEKEYCNRWTKSTIKWGNRNINIKTRVSFYKNLEIKKGAGKINIQSLKTQGLYLELGAGDVYIENLVVTKEARIDGGVGEIKIDFNEKNIRDM